MADDLASYEAELTERVPCLLEAMNSASEEVNRMEGLLDVARVWRQQLLDQWEVLYEDIDTRNDRILAKVRPYLRAKDAVRIASQRVSCVTAEYSESVARHDATRREILAVEKDLTGSTERVSVGLEQQHLLSELTVRVLECQQTRDRLERENAIALHEFHTARATCAKVQSVIGDSFIRRALPFIQKLQQHQAEISRACLQVSALVKQAADAKDSYSESLRELDRISNAVHSVRTARACASEPEVEVAKAEDTLPAEKGHDLPPPEVSPELDSDADDSHAGQESLAKAESPSGGSEGHAHEVTFLTD